MSISRQDLTNGVTERLQNAQAGAANGNGVDADANGAVNVVGVNKLTVAVSGTFTGITANFEGAVTKAPVNADFFPVGLLNSAGARATTATAVGLYNLPADVPPLTRFRARTTVAAPTGAMTVDSRKQS
jgi:hypothetical protein